MTDLIEQFQKISRRKADAKLISRWEHHIRYDGDKKIKADLAQARRVATQLDNACATFTNLDPEQQLAFKAAASGMRKLATDLSALALWAKDYSVFYRKEQERITNEEYQAKSLERWGNDESKFKLECKIIRELQTREGALTFIEWLRGQATFAGYQDSRIVLPFHNFPKNTDSMKQLDVMRFLAESHTRYRYFGSGFAHACTEDYENYLKFRLEFERINASLIQQVKDKQSTT